MICEPDSLSRPAGYYRKNAVYRYCSAFLLSFVWLTANLPDIALADAQQAYFMTHPAPSPDGSMVVFSFEGDLWSVPATGGTATRLTAMPGEETHPRFSPDGKYIAFSGEQDGTRSIYIMPTEGGEIRRLTWHDGSNLVSSWAWDSSGIRFSSDRYNYIDSYEVSVNGGTPVRLINNHFFNLPHDIAQNPTNGDFVFNDTWESFRFYQRKQYRGPFNPALRSYNPETQVYTRLTSHDGKNMWPSFDQNGSLFYTSDEYNDEYNLFRLTEDGPEQLTGFSSSIYRPQVSAGGEIVVFEKDFQIWSYHTSSGETGKVDIRIPRNPTLHLPVSFNTAGNISAFDISPNHKKKAFVSRGELFVSDIEGEFVRKMNTSPNERVSEVRWLSDDELIFTQTQNGFFNLYKIKADGSGSEHKLTSHEMHHRNIQPNSDRSAVAYFRGRNDLMLYTPDSNSHLRLHEDEFWTYANRSIKWSPDDRFIAFSNVHLFELNILAVEISSREVIHLTYSGVSESAPFWSPCGRYLYFNSDRVQPIYPRGNDQPDIYRMQLTPVAPPLRMDRFDELFTSSSNDNDKEETKPEVKIDTEFLHERWEQITRHSGRQHGPYVIGQGDKEIIIYGSAHDGEGPGLWKTVLEPFKAHETNKISGIRSFNTDIISAGDSHYVLAGGDIFKLNLNNNSAERVVIGHSFTKKLGDEFNQIFYETWANLEENFYDETFHGRDWHQIREYYSQFLPHLNSRADLRMLTNRMLGELNASHMGFASSGEEESTYYKNTTLATGILFDNANPYQLKRIVRHSSAWNAGFQQTLRAGDMLVRVNGSQVDPKQNREYYFSSPDAGGEMELEFLRGNRKIVVRLQSQSSGALRNHLYDEWIQQKQEKVDSNTEKQIAYIHMKNMGAGELQHFRQEIARQFVHRNGLILDLRNNTGGNVHDEVIQILSRRSYLNWQFRSGKMASQPNFAPSDSPLVILINEQSLSDAEMTTAGLRQLEIGTVIGMPTYRWIIFTTGLSLVDGSFHRLPAWGVYAFDGTNLELSGVDPDIKVEKTFADRLRGDDPQLQFAIDYIKNLLHQNGEN
ncbi:MAG: peptidase S41 [Balneolales bacterium]|nr:peptidase S41 [Balneolales bacterium]